MSTPKLTWLDKAFFGDDDAEELEALAIPALQIDWSLTDRFHKALGVGANVFTFANEGVRGTITVRLTGNPGGSTVAWPAAVRWQGGSEPTQTPTGTDVYTFWSDGTNTYGSVIPDMS